MKELEEQLRRLNEIIKSFKIYDDENPEFFLNEIKYNEKEDKFYFICDCN